MTDLYLRAADEAAMIAALSFARARDKDGAGVWIAAGRGFALDILGPVVTTPATYDDKGGQLTPAVLDDRFHANLRCTAVIAALVPAAIIIDPPATPARVWFGD